MDVSVLTKHWKVFLNAAALVLILEINILSNYASISVKEELNILPLLQPFCILVAI